MSWLSDNALSLYGAITGTAALGISFFNYRHNIKKERIKLALSVSPDPNQAENVTSLKGPTDPEAPWDWPFVVKVYQVTVRNLSSVPAPIEDAGVISKDGKRHSALVSRNVGHANMLDKISISNKNTIAPRGFAVFNVYLHRDQALFEPRNVFAVDQTGKEWRSRA